MASFAESIYLLKDSYSGVFVCFWAFMVVCCAGVWNLEKRDALSSYRLERALFWVFGVAMVGFSALRPIGIAQDDLAYLDIYNKICPALSCGEWVQGSRDWGWYSLVGLLKSLVPNPKVMLWLGSAALLLKLGIMYSLVQRPLFSLLLYLGLYYEVQDLTAWRVSLAIAAFFAAIWLVVRLRNYWNSWAFFACGLFHKQAFVAPLILVGCLLKRSRWLLIAACCVPIFLMVLGLSPEVQQIIPLMGSGIQNMVVTQGLDSYIAVKYSGAYHGWRQAPIVVYPQIIFILWFLIKDRLSNNRMDSLMAGCLIVGCIFLWAFASLPDVQVRFFEFFMAPTVLMLGVKRLSLLEMFGLIFVSCVYVAKYNVVHNLLT